MNKVGSRNKSPVKNRKLGGNTVQHTAETLTLHGVVKPDLKQATDTHATVADRENTENVTMLAEERAAPSPVFPSRWCSPRGEWQTMWEAVVGLAHRDSVPPTPCQDAAGAVNKPRPIILIADGAGSSAVWEVGAGAVVTATLRLLDTIEHDTVAILDSVLDVAASTLNRFAKMLVKHAKGTLSDIAEIERRSIRDFRCTFLCIVLGKARTIWVKVGDGALIIERIEVATSAKSEEKLQLLPHLTILGSPGKGEFANQTTFVDDQLSVADVQWGVVDARLITGAAVMSDGAAEKLVSHDGSRALGT